MLLFAAFQVVTPENASPWEKTAAKELEEFLGRMGYSADTRFIVGDDPALRSEEWVIEGSGMRDQGSGMRDEVRIAGGGTRGTLYGVYHFLEDVCGVRFWSESEIDVPRFAAVPPSLSHRGKPYFIYRDIYRNMKPAESTSAFAVRRRLNRNGEVFIPAEFGGTDWKYGPPFHAHSFIAYCNWKDHGKDHPEWFAFRDGVRQGGSGIQLCVTNPELRRHFLAKMEAYIAKGEAEAKSKGVPAPKMYDCSMNDSPNLCQCEVCLASYSKYGESGTYLDFYNEIARAVAEKHPGVYVSTLAYYFTEELPKGGIVPEKNLIVRLCDTRSNQAASINEPGNGVFLDLLKKWGPITKNLFVWDYAAIYAESTKSFPFPSEFYWADQFRAYADNGVKGIFLEHEDQQVGDLWEIKYYLETKLMEDPFQDNAALLKDAFSRYFGPAAKAVWQLRRHLDRLRRDSKAFIGWTPELGEFDFITPDEAKRMQAMWDEAERLAAGDERYLRRVRKARKGTDNIGRLIAEFERFRRGDGFVFEPDDLDPVGWRHHRELYRLVDDPESPSKRALVVNSDYNQAGHYKMPFLIGLRDQAKRKTVAEKFFKEFASDSGYGVYTLEDVAFPKDSFIFTTRSWSVQKQTGYPQLTKSGKRYDVKVHVKFTGPDFHPGSTERNEVWFGRMEVVPRAAGKGAE